MSSVVTIDVEPSEKIIINTDSINGKKNLLIIK